MIKVNYKKKYLTIWVNKFYDYDIDFKRLKNNEDWWFNHLSKKNWFNGSLQYEWNNIIKELKSKNYVTTKNV